MRGTILALAASGILVSAVLSQAHANNLLVNGDFEGGVTSSTIGGYTNNSVPDGWSATIGYDYQPGFNHIQTGSYYVESGVQSLSIGNYDYDLYVATLTQTFSDVSGATYSVSFWAFDGGANGDSSAYLNVSAGGLTLSLDDTNAYPYAEFGFTFIGSGTDTLTIAAQTDPSEWYVDNVGVSGLAATPLPSTWTMLVAGFAGLGFFAYRSSKKNAASLAA